MSRRDRLLVAGALLLGLFFIAQNAWQMDWALERFNAYYRPLDLAGAPPVAQGRVPKLFWDDDSYMHLALLREGGPWIEGRRLACVKDCKTHRQATQYPADSRSSPAEGMLPRNEGQHQAGGGKNYCRFPKCSGRALTKR